MKEALLLGVAREDITPPVGGHLFGYSTDIFSTEVHDPLQVTAFYLKQEQTTALMVNATICLVNTELSDRIRREICEASKVPFGHIMLCATHTHSGPNVTKSPGWGDIDMEYVEGIFLPRILSAVKNAAANTTAVTVGIGTGTSLVGINRRQLNADNQVVLGQNPWGPFNPEMTVISFRDAQENTVANIISYGAHGTAAGHHTAISRDWSGVMVDRLEELTGGLTAFFNGAAGDVGPRLTNGRTTGIDNIHYVEEHGGLAAADAVRIYRTINCYREADLACYAGVTRLPVKPRLSPEEATARLQALEGATSSLSTATRVHLQEILASYTNGYEEQEAVDVPQTLIRIGEVAFAGFPYELFSEIAMRIAQASTIPHVLSLSYTNGHEHYFVTESELCRGGYEVGVHKLAGLQEWVDDADWYLMKETVKNLKELLQEASGK